MPTPIYRSYFIYKAIEKLTGLIYIGQTVDTIESRFEQHLYGSSTDFDRAYTNPDDFEIEILLEMKNVEHDPDNRLAPARVELDNHEKHFIAENNATDPAIGYNRSKGGEGYGTTSKSSLSKNQRVREKWEAEYGQPWISKRLPGLDKPRPEWEFHNKLKRRGLFDARWSEHRFGWQRFYHECGKFMKPYQALKPIDKSKLIGLGNFRICSPYEDMDTSARTSKRHNKDKKQFLEEHGFRRVTKRENRESWNSYDRLRKHKEVTLLPDWFYEKSYGYSRVIHEAGFKPDDGKYYLLWYDGDKFFWKQHNIGLQFVTGGYKALERELEVLYNAQASDQLFQIPALRETWHTPPEVPSAAKSLI